MVPEIKQEWIAELEDEDLIQAKGGLGYADGSRCCLGVLCDIAVRHGVIDYPEQLVDDCLSYAGASGYPPASVYQWSGLTDHEATRLSTMNDSGYPFTTIAQTIREAM